MNRIKVLVLALVLLMTGVMCSCSAVTDLVEELESQVNLIEEEINNDISIDDFEDDEYDIYPLPADLYDWDDEYAATFGEVAGYEYDAEDSDPDFLIYNALDYETGADSIYITADKAEFMDDGVYQYYREDIESFSEYVADDDEYGKFEISDEKKLSLDNMEISYFEIYYPAYTRHFYETVAWTYSAAANAYVNLSIESCVSEKGKVYDSEAVIKAIFSAMTMDGESIAETEAAENNVPETEAAVNETTANEPESVAKDIVDAFR